MRNNNEKISMVTIGHVLTSSTEELNVELENGTIKICSSGEFLKHNLGGKNVLITIETTDLKLLKQVLK